MSLSHARPNLHSLSLHRGCRQQCEIELWHDLSYPLPRQQHEMLGPAVDTAALLDGAKVEPGRTPDDRWIVTQCPTSDATSKGLLGIDANGRRGDGGEREPVLQGGVGGAIPTAVEGDGALCWRCVDGLDRVCGRWYL
jgi:hypothetical protein